MSHIHRIEQELVKVRKAAKTIEAEDGHDRHGDELRVILKALGEVERLLKTLRAESEGQTSKSD
jgi:hypothetical protein